MLGFTKEMLSVFLLVSSIEYGLTKPCSDPQITLMEQPLTIIEYLGQTEKVFKANNPRLSLPHSSGCVVTNTETEVQFDVSKLGEITNYQIISVSPNHTHSRGIKQAVLKLPILKTSLGSVNNRIKISYAMFQGKT